MSSQVTGQTLTDIHDRPLDVLIYGAGLLGAGLARDAAMRGLRVALVEEKDFASRTDAPNNGLLYGGLCYLAKGQARRLRKSSQEKMILGAIAPHLVSSLKLQFPAYLDSSPSFSKLRLGLRLYSRYTRSDLSSSSDVLSAAQSLERRSGLESSGLTGSILYTDSFASEFRLIMDTLKSASSLGAMLYPYTSLDSVEWKDKNWVCRLGSTGGDSLEVEAKCILNASGAPLTPNGSTYPSIHRMRGVSLFFDRSDIPLNQALAFPLKGHVFYAIPWGKRMILSSRETPALNNGEESPITPEDIDDLLSAVRHRLPEPAIDPDMIRAWRTDLYPSGGTRRFTTQSPLGRRHICKGDHGWWDILGGPLVLHRLIAEKAVDRVIDHLGLRARPCKTDKQPLIGTYETATQDDIPEEISEQTIRQICETEWPTHLDDLMIRRTGWGFYFPFREDEVKNTANIMGDCLGWSEETVREELNRYRSLRPDRLPV